MEMREDLRKGEIECGVLVKERNEAKLRLTEISRSVQITQEDILAIERDVRHVEGILGRSRIELEQETTSSALQVR